MSGGKRDNAARECWLREPTVRNDTREKLGASVAARQAMHSTWLSSRGFAILGGCGNVGRGGLTFLLLVVLAACGSEGNPPSDDAAAVACPGGDCSLSCDPSAVALAFGVEGAGDPTLTAVGDIETASPEEVGDGKYHLFGGVYDSDLISGTSGTVLLHEAVADQPDGPYTLDLTPLSQRDQTDAFGMETPAYFRWDARTEYLYYCALTSEVTGRIAALKRVDGGAWSKVSAVAPLGPGSTSQCEPDVVRDPTSGKLHLFFAANGDRAGTLVRTSDDPELFGVEGEQLLESLGARTTASFDPVARVWRFVYDDAYVTSTTRSLQTWATTLVPDASSVVAHEAVMHEKVHPTDLHPDVHPVTGGLAYQPSSPFYLAGGDVLFFFSGVNTAPTSFWHRIYSQRCTR